MTSITTLKKSGLLWYAASTNNAAASDAASQFSPHSSLPHSALPRSTYLHSTYPCSTPPFSTLCEEIASLKQSLGLLPGSTHLFIPAHQQQLGSRAALHAPKLLPAALLSALLCESLLREHSAANQCTDTHSSFVRSTHVDSVSINTSSYRCAFIIGKFVWPSALFIEHIVPARLRNDVLKRLLYVSQPTDKGPSQSQSVQSQGMALLQLLRGILHSPATCCVLADVSAMAKAQSRALSLAAKKGGSLGIFTQQSPTAPLQHSYSRVWQVRYLNGAHEPRTSPLRDGELSVDIALELLKVRGTRPQTRHWRFSFLKPFLQSENSYEQLPFHCLPVLDVQPPHAETTSNTPLKRNLG